MIPSRISAKIVAERTSWIRKMLESLRSLPCESAQAFQADHRTVAATESYLRRALEALLDLGRHILARAFGYAAVEYKEIAIGLHQKGVLDEAEAGLLRELAGYRNRMVHFYSEVTTAELFEIRSVRLNDIERVLLAMLRWVNANPDRVDRL